MIYVHSLGRAARYFPERTALAANGTRSTFRELHARVGRIAAALTKHGFKAGDRLAILLPNEPDYIQLVYACAWLGVIAVPLNTRLSVKEIDGILSDANPRGLIRHSSLPVPTAQVSWQLVLDQEPLDVQSDSIPDPIYDPDAILALIYTSGTTGRPKGVEIRHANILENVYHTNFWFPLEEGAVHLHAAPIFHIADFPFMFAAPAFGACQVTIPKFNPQTFCETVQRERVTHTVLVPTMINMLTQFPELQKYDLTTLRHLGYGGSPMAPELVHRTRQVLPNVKLVQVYGLSEAGFLTGLLDHEHTEDKLTSCGRPCLGIDVRVVDPTGKEVETGKTGELVARGANIMRGYWNNPEETKARVPERLFPNRRHWLSRRQRILLHSRSLERHDRHRRRECLFRRSRSRHLHASGSSRSGGFRNTRSEVGRNRKGCRCSQAGENTHCGRVDRVLPTIARQFQSSAQHPIFRHRATEERLRQNTKEASA